MNPTYPAPVASLPAIFNTPCSGAVDWSKLDAGLAGALAGEEVPGCYAVFLLLAIDVAPAVLAIEASGEGRVRTATVSSAEVDRLSDQEWVNQLRMSTTLNPAGEG